MSAANIAAMFVCIEADKRYRETLNSDPAYGVDLLSNISWAGPVLVGVLLVWAAIMFWMAWG